MQNNTDEKLDVILNLYRRALVSWVEQSEFDNLKNNPAFKNGDEYNSALKYLKTENYINDQGITPKGEKFAGFVETTRLEKELLKERAILLGNSNKSISLTIKNINWTKAAVVIAFVALIATLFPLLNSSSSRVKDPDELVFSEKVVEKKGVYYFGDCANHADYKYTGTDTGYYQNRKIWGTSTLKDGLPNGHWEQYDSTGTKKLDLYFDNGELVKKVIVK